MTKATSMHAFPAVRTLADVEAIERTPLGKRLDADSTYEVLRRAARNYGDRPALRFLAKGTPDEDAVVVTYAELLRRRDPDRKSLRRARRGTRRGRLLRPAESPPRHTTRSGALRRPGS